MAPDPQRELELFKNYLPYYDIAISKQEGILKKMKKGTLRFAEVSDNVLIALANWELNNIKANLEAHKKRILVLEDIVAAKENHSSNRPDDPDDSEFGAGGGERRSDQSSRGDNKENPNSEQEGSGITNNSSNKATDSENQAVTQDQEGTTSELRPSEQDDAVEEQPYLDATFDVDPNTARGLEKELNRANLESEQACEPALDPVLSSVAEEKTEDSSSEKRTEPESSTKSPKESSPPPEAVEFDLNQNSEEFQLDYWT